MTGTSNQGDRSENYQSAQASPENRIDIPQTSQATSSPKAVRVRNRESDIDILMIPRPPRQTGDEARTD